MTSVDAMVARLASSLAIAEGRKQVDLRPTQGKGQRQADVFMLGKLLTAREYKTRSFMGMFRNAWRVNGSLRVEEAEGQRVLITLSDATDRDRIWKGSPWGYNHAPISLTYYDGVAAMDSVPFTVSSYWITQQGIPPTFRSERVMTMIGFTLGDFKEIDKQAKKVGKLRIRVEIPFNRPLSFQRWYWVEDEVEFLCKFQFDKLFGRCSICGYVTHVGLPCSGPPLEENDEAERTVLGTSQMGHPNSTSGSASSSTVCAGTRARVCMGGPDVVFRTVLPNQLPERLLHNPAVLLHRPRRPAHIRELPEMMVIPESVIGQRRQREEDTIMISPKKLKLSLAVGKRNLNLEPEHLGLVPVMHNEEQPIQVKRKRGRPAGSRNKQPYGEKKKVKQGDENRAVKKKLLPKLDKAGGGTGYNPKGKELVLY